MFPPTIASGPKKRSLRELVRDAVGTAVEFATLGEAYAPARIGAPAPSAPRSGHPHGRIAIDRHPRRRRPGTVPPRPQVCVTPVHRPARRA